VGVAPLDEEIDERLTDLAGLHAPKPTAPARNPRWASERSVSSRLGVGPGNRQQGGSRSGIERHSLVVSRPLNQTGRFRDGSTGGAVRARPPRLGSAPSTGGGINGACLL